MDFFNRLMVQNKSGLIVNISSLGGWQYIFNVAYTVGKSGCDRMATDCAIELKKENVAMVSLWPGAVKTEFVQEHMSDKSNYVHCHWNLDIGERGWYHLHGGPMNSQIWIFLIGRTFKLAILTGIFQRLAIAVIGGTGHWMIVSLQSLKLIIQSKQW